MGRSIQSRIAECEEKIAMYQARHDKATTAKMADKSQKAIDAWKERLQEAQDAALRSLEKRETASQRSSTSVGMRNLWAEPEKEVTFAEEPEYTEILESVGGGEITAAQRRELLKKIRTIEISCGLLHDMELEDAPLETLEEHLKSLVQQATRQAKTVSGMASTLYIGLLINGPTIINHYSNDLGFHIDKLTFTDSLKNQETINGIQTAFAEIFEDSPEIKQLFTVVSRGLPKLAAITAMAIAPSVRMGALVEDGRKSQKS